jgi:hypothetical protein
MVCSMALDGARVAECLPCNGTALAFATPVRPRMGVPTVCSSPSGPSAQAGHQSHERCRRHQATDHARGIVPVSTVYCHRSDPLR